MPVPSVTVIVPTRGMAPFVLQAVKTLFLSVTEGVAALDVVIVEGGGEESKSLIDKHFTNKPVRWMKAEDDWSFSQINNAAAATSTSDFVLLLNNDVVCRQGFLAEMLKVMADKPEVGVVGAKLLFPDGGIQHIGVVFRSDGVPQHLGYCRKDDGTYAPATRSDYYDAVTFACALIRRSVWEQVGGLDEAYHFNYEDVDFCLKAREAGWRSYVAMKAVLTHLENQSAGLRKGEKHGVSRNLRILRDKWLDTGKMEALTGLRINKKSNALRDERLNVAMIPSGRGAGVPWWRVELPARKLQQKGLANIVTLYADMNTEAVIDLMSRADVVLFQGFCQQWVLNIAGLGAHQRPFRMAYDYDDHPLYISPYAQAYRFFGTQEINMRDPKTGDMYWLWRDGENLNIAENMANRQRQLEILRRVEMVTTTTMALHEYFSTLNRNVTLLPNSIDFEVYRTMQGNWQRRPGPVRIGWHGGDNHYHDILTVGKLLTDYVNSHDVQLVLFGAYYRSAFSGIDPNKVIEEGWVHVEAFPHKLANLGIDVAVIPLADATQPFMAFNGYKSNIKYLEYSALKIPTLVVEGAPAYAGCADTDNCLTYSTPREFTEKLDRLCQDAELRERLAGRAYDYVREHYDLDKNIHRWLRAYEQLAQMELPVPPEDEEMEDGLHDVGEAIDAAVPDEELRPAGSNAGQEMPAAEQETPA